MVYIHVLLVGALLIGAGVGISLGSLMEHRRISIDTIHWISRILALVGSLMGFYALKTLGDLI
jgi:hypothetical protein